MDIKEYGKSLLKMLQAFDPRAVIAGGWARDYLLGLDIVDVDIYLHANQYALAEHMRTLGAHCLHDNTARLAYSKYGFGVQKYEHLGMRIDLIVLRDQSGRGVIHNFDLNICRAAFDGEAFFVTELFERDRRNQQITFNFTPWALANMAKVTTRADRLSKKLGWPVVYTHPDNIVPWSTAQANADFIST